MAGFTPVYNLHGCAPIVRDFAVASGYTSPAIGDIVNIESGEAALGAAGDTLLAGAVLAINEAGTVVTVNVDPTTVYEVTDANARAEGATLDLNATADGVAASSATDLVVIESSAATAPTRVRIIPSSHYMGG
ncbi:MAG: hypothetical protein AAF787_00205 [Chloroflexota bacterium]